jgi:hypothetical protein
MAAKNVDMFLVDCTFHPCNWDSQRNAFAASAQTWHINYFPSDSIKCPSYRKVTLIKKLGEAHRLRLSENRVMRRIFEPQKEEMAGAS